MSRSPNKKPRLSDDLEVSDGDDSYCTHSQRALVDKMVKYHSPSKPGSIQGLYVVSPPGTGKTYIARDYIDRLMKTPDRLFVIYAADSAAQSYAQAEEIGAKGTKNSLGVLRLGELVKLSQREGKTNKHSVVSMPNRSVRNLLKDAVATTQLCKTYGYNWVIILDEAHKLTKYSKFVDAFFATYPYMPRNKMSFRFILLSATPQFDHIRDGSKHKAHVSKLCNISNVESPTFLIKASSKMVERVANELNPFKEKRHPRPPEFTDKYINPSNLHLDEVWDEFCCMLIVYHRLQHNNNTNLNMINALKHCGFAAELRQFGKYHCFMEQFDPDFVKAKIDGRPTPLGNSAYVVCSYLHAKDDLKQYSQDGNFDFIDLSQDSADKVQQKLFSADQRALKKGRTGDERADLIFLQPAHLTSVNHFTGRTCNRIIILGTFDEGKKIQIAGRLGRNTIPTKETPIFNNYVAYHMKLATVHHALDLKRGTLTKENFQKICGSSAMKHWNRLAKLDDDEVAEQYDETFKNWLVTELPDQEREDDLLDE
jgi:hypothetical protein